MPAGKVVSTDPPAGQKADFGSTVKVHVSKGPDLVQVPDETGHNVVDATNALNNLGFNVTVSGNFRPNKTVKSQQPDSGKVVRGSTITLVL